MPAIAPVTFCAEPGCAEKVTRGRCALHERVDHRRTHPHDWVYKDRRWSWLSKRVRREEPLCRIQANGCTRVTEVADHIVPHRGNVSLAFNRRNLQGACRFCNSVKGKRE